MRKIIISATIMVIAMGDARAMDYCISWGEQGVYHYDLSKCIDETAYFVSMRDIDCATMNEPMTVVWSTEESGCHYIKYCKTCPSGYELKYEDTGWKWSDFCFNPDRDDELQNMPLEVAYCVKSCASCTNCASTGYTAYGTGYERMIERECLCDGTCKSQNLYRCAVGYYGTSTNGTTGCTRCPEADGIYTNAARTTKARGTSRAGSNYERNCGLAPGTYYDITGTFTINYTCPWK